jgi:Tfp pilus assembly protein PilN
MLHGIAESNKDVAGFLERLSSSVLFSDVNLMFLREETMDKRSVVEFKIETYLKGI